MNEKLLIGIGTEIGTRKLPSLIRRFKVSIMTGFLSRPDVNHFRTLDGLHIALRVGGEIKSYAKQDPEPVRRMRGKPYVTTEWVLLPEDWQGKSEEELLEVLDVGLTSSFERLLQFALSKNEVLDETRSRREFKEVKDQVLNSQSAREQGSDYDQN